MTLVPMYVAPAIPTVSSPSSSNHYASNIGRPAIRMLNTHAGALERASESPLLTELNI